MKATKRIISLLLSAVMVACVMTVAPFTVSAVITSDGGSIGTQSMSGNFNKGYTLTGNAAQDMVSIAQAQNNRTQYQMGYSEAWCADFVSDCAKLAGQSSAVPFNGLVSTHYSAVINAGGYGVSSAQAGDLVYYKNPNTGGWMHVGIMINSTTAISGNYWLTNSYGQVCTHNYNSYYDEYGSRCTAYFVRPAYKNAGNNPIGILDSAAGGMNKITIRGWAFDPDNYSAQLDIHVYIGGSAGSGAPCYAIKANTYRPDVNNFYGCGDYHGYETDIKTDRVGSQPIYVYAINVGGGENVLIGNANVNIAQDTEKPVISNIKITEVTSTSYKVSCNVSDNTGVTSVKFPSWLGGQSGDKAVWLNGTISNGVAYCYIPIVELGNVKGTYYTHIYAYDEAGNCSSANAGGTYIDAKKINEREPVDIGNNFTASIVIFNDTNFITVTQNSQNVVSGVKNNLDNQRWKFTRNDDKTYTITSLFNGKCLDVEGGGKGASGTNVQTYEPNNTDNQRWYIYRSDNGRYWLRPKSSENCVLDLFNCDLSDGANIGIYNFNATNAQSFIIYDERKINDYSIADLGNKFEATIKNIGAQKVLGVDTSNDNVTSQTDRNTDEQCWTFIKNTDGSYTVKSKINGKYLDVAGGKDISNSNVQTYSTDEINAHKWFLYEAGGGAYYIKPALSENCVVDLMNYNINEGANIIIHRFNSTTAQRFYINKKTLLGDVDLDGYVNVKDATEIQKHLAELIELTDAQKAVADVNGDGEINILDATDVQKFLVQLIDKLG